MKSTTMLLQALGGGKSNSLSRSWEEIAYNLARSSIRTLLCTSTI